MPSPYCSPDDVLARLKLAPTHPDAPYVTDCTTVACELIDDELGYYDADGVIVLPSAPYPERLRRAAIGAAVDVYQYKDKESDTSGGWGSAPAPASPRRPNDPLARYRTLLDADRHAWGIG